MKTRREFLGEASRSLLALGASPAVSRLERFSITQTGTGLVTDPRYLDHVLPARGGEPHPERPLRLVRIAEAFASGGLDDEMTVIPQLADPMPFIRAHHTREHVDSVEQIEVTGPVAALAAAGALGAVDAVARGQVGCGRRLCRRDDRRGHPQPRVGSAWERSTRKSTSSRTLLDIWRPGGSTAQTVRGASG